MFNQPIGRYKTSSNCDMKKRVTKIMISMILLFLDNERTTLLHGPGSNDGVVWCRVTVKRSRWGSRRVAGD